MTPRQQEILDAIIANPGLSMRKVAKLTGTSQSMASKVKSIYLPNRAGYTRRLCLGPGPDHHFLSPDPTRIVFCQQHKYLTRLEQPETYRVVTRG